MTKTKTQTPNFTLATFETDPLHDEILDKFLKNTENISNDTIMAQVQSDKENQMVPQNVNSNTFQSPQNQNQNFQSITQNFDNAPIRPFFPTMHFSNSNVTVNYNFYGGQK